MALYHSADPGRGRGVFALLLPAAGRGLMLVVQPAALAAREVRAWARPRGRAGAGGASWGRGRRSANLAAHLRDAGLESRHRR